jgi:hypothetical protein
MTCECLGWGGVVYANWLRRKGAGRRSAAYVTRARLGGDDGFEAVMLGVWTSMVRRIAGLASGRSSATLRPFSGQRRRLESFTALVAGCVVAG